MSIDNVLYVDIIVYILNMLDDMDIINFIKTNKKINAIKKYVKFNNIYDINKIIGTIYLKNIKYISLMTSINTKIPDNITHLTFDYNFNQDIKECIPTSVTHLTFSDKFNQNIKECIPNSVTHLTLGNDFKFEI